MLQSFVVGLFLYSIFAQGGTIELFVDDTATITTYRNAHIAIQRTLKSIPTRFYFHIVETQLELSLHLTRTTRNGNFRNHMM